MEYGVIAPLRGEKYELMKKWLELFRTGPALCIYGAGKRGKLLLRWLREEHIEIAYFIDRDIRLPGGGRGGTGYVKGYGVTGNSQDNHISI